MQGKTFVILRWALIPLLLYLLGQYLEGPPYRVIVRSAPFIVACFALSALAAQFLRQQRDIPLWFSLLQGAGVPLGFVIAVQGYYNGGKNSDYALVSALFFVLMIVNGGAYLNSLFCWRKKMAIKSLNQKPGPIKSYKIKLHRLNEDGNKTGIKHQEEGTTERPEWIFVDGFERDQAIDLNEYWDLILADGVEDFQTDVTIRETIIKFGETQQLVDHYRLIIQTTFEH